MTLFNTITIKIPVTFFTELGIRMKAQKIANIQANPEQKQYWGYFEFWITLQNNSNKTKQYPTRT